MNSFEELRELMKLFPLGSVFTDEGMGFGDEPSASFDMIVKGYEKSEYHQKKWAVVCSVRKVYSENQHGKVWTVRLSKSEILREWRFK